MTTPIRYYSTNGNAPLVSFTEALLKGQAPDKGLYLPQTLPQITPDELRSFSGQPYADIAFAIGRKFLASELPETQLRAIVDDAYNFPVPLERVYDRAYVMRLDQGPTASFKDFAARMMGRLMQYFLKQANRNLLILTATSGDTGSAVASAFYGLENIKVLILYPEKEVSDRQRKQMTTLGQNVQTIALDGKFDDCQALVKRAFADSELAYLPLSSANSINIGRLLPQMMYYFYAFAQLRDGADTDSIVFSVPSGNFGDLMGGLIAHKMGLPVKKFVVAVNENDEFPKFVATGRYEKIVPSRDCLSNAMNVGHPSNFARLVALYGGQIDEQGQMSKLPDMDLIRQDMYAISITDAATKATIQQVYQKYQVLLEPHGAVAWAGWQAYVKAYPHDAQQLCVAFETAHPAKFPEHLREILGVDPALPPSMQGLDDKPEITVQLPHNYDAFKQYVKTSY